MSNDERRRPWGYVDQAGVFRPLPRWPGVEQLPPFDVTLPSGEVRHIIWAPEADNSPEGPEIGA